MLYLKMTILFICSSLWLFPNTFEAQASEKNVENKIIEKKNIIFNEIHYNAEPKTALSEFVELYNAGTSTVILSGWAIDGGIEYLIPDGTALAPNTYLIIAQEPNAISKKYAFSTTMPILGPYQGNLSTGGERLILRDHQGEEIDQLEYKLGFPWPTVNVITEDQSIGLIHPLLDNSHPGSWRSGSSTPGRTNIVINTGESTPPLPLISQVTHHPQSPRSGEAVTITIQIAQPITESSVTLAYQPIDPGSYIRQSDPLYATHWLTQTMHHKGNGIYSARLSGDLQTHRRLMRYRIHVTDNAGNTLTVPYADDPQTNFAYFVYDGVPPWIGAINPDDPDDMGELTRYDFDQIEPAPVYHFIAQSEDVNAALFEQPRGEGYQGHEEKWQGTLVYDGIVYDHLPFRARGGYWRYAMGKNMWKFNFMPGHRLQARDQDGAAYPTQWDKLNLNGIIQQGFFEHRGEQGLFESVSYRLFQLAGVASSDTHYVHFRVIDDAEENGTSQYEGDFWGLYLAVEQVDGRFLDAHNLLDGNLYKMDIEEDKLSNQGSTGVIDSSDLLFFQEMYEEGEPDETWWRANFDLAGYYSYRSILEAIHHYDTGEDKNYFYYLNPESQRWSVLPWDVDLTWDNEMYGTGREPFLEAVLSQPIFQLEYQNRLREIRDLLYNPEQMRLLIDEYVNRVDKLEWSPSLVDADRAMWDYNPIMTSNYVREERAGIGRYYEKSPTGDFRGMAQRMKNYVESRSQWIDKRLLTDRVYPTTPSLTYLGPVNYPADQLIFQTSSFQGRVDFAGLQWRVAAITDPVAPDYDPLSSPQYEITARWESPIYTRFEPEIRLPNGACPVGQTCRVRVRMQDHTGRWSHWSEPIQFAAGSPTLPPPTGLHITEIMYHPLTDGPWLEDDFEFIELANLGDETIDLSGMAFSDGIRYTFPMGTHLAAGEMIVLAENERRFAERYGFIPFDKYSGKLSDGGEDIILDDAFGRTVYGMTYDDKTPWSQLADGYGYSLVPRFASYIADRTPDEAIYWRRSAQKGGSPGQQDVY